MSFRRPCSFGVDGTRCLFGSCYNCEWIEDVEETHQEEIDEHEEYLFI